MHRYDDAIAQHLKALEIDPNFRLAQDKLVETYTAKGMYEQAIEQRRKLRLLQGQPPEEVEKRAAALKEAYRSLGERGYWQKALELAKENALKNKKEIRRLDLAGFQIRMGNKEESLDFLEKAVSSGDRYGLIQLKANPVWDPLRTEPRFQELLRKIGLPT